MLFDIVVGNDIHIQQNNTNHNECIQKKFHQFYGDHIKRTKDKYNNKVDAVTRLKRTHNI